MSSLADQMLQDGFDQSLLSVHGETLTMLTGASQGKTFTAFCEAKPSLVIEGVVVEDNREKIIANFSNSNYPNVAPEDKMQDSNGIIWIMVQRTINEHDNTTDMEFRKWVNGVDT